MGILGNTQEKLNVKYEVKEPVLYKVLIYNDDFTTMDFVMWILQNIFSKTPEEAYNLMMTVHKGSYGIAGVYPKDIAVTKAEISMSYARKEGYPLKVEAVAE